MAAEDSDDLLFAVQNIKAVSQDDADEYPLEDHAACEACEGTGLAWLGALGVGDDGRQCPYCFPFRTIGYPVGQIDPRTRTLPYERATGRRWFQDWDQKTQIPTIPPRRLRHSVPIARPRERTAPMSSNFGGMVRHFTRHFTGPVTRWNRQRNFMDGAYPILRAQLERRERRRQQMKAWLFSVAEGALIAVTLATLVVLFIVLWRAYIMP